MRSRILMVALATAGMTVGYATPAAAQATRTWVSGVGDDVNPCSRTAPCKTFAGAISKTAAGGEINCLDPGGFGAVTITKSLTIDCHYTEGGALAGGNGITVNDSLSATPNQSVVTIRGLDIFGVNPPTHGVRVIAAAAVHIEDSVIRRFNAANSFGISFQPGAQTRLYITNTTVAQNGNGGSGGGILIQPTGAGGGARVYMKDVRVFQNANQGLRIDTTSNTAPFGTIVDVEESSFASNNNGVVLVGGGTPAILMINDSNISMNLNVGISSNGANATGRVGNTTITGNGTGILLNGGALHTYGNNRVDGNLPDGAFTLPALVED
ncbi:MAG TPA: hypothetical protein VGB04_06070 [Allosphingosinicella sp.]